MDHCDLDKLKRFLAGRASEHEQREIEAFFASNPTLPDNFESICVDDDDNLIERIRHTSLDYSNEPAFQEGLIRSRSILSETRSFALPHSFGNYLLTSQVREGGTCSVYLAVDRRWEREVAIKILKIDPLLESRTWERFAREAAMISQLSHPNIVRVLETNVTEQRPCIVMERLKGFDLSQLISRIGPVDVKCACEIIRQTSLALAELSQRGLVHRDVKPSNIFLTDSGIIKLLDLGVARYHDGSTETTLTGSDQVVGTLDYMAPEQLIDSRKADMRSDIYGLGCTFYKLLIGMAPFAGKEYDHPFRKAVAHSVEAMESLRATRTDLPRSLDGLIQRMCAKDPTRRPQSYLPIIQTASKFASAEHLATLVQLAQKKPAGTWNPPTSSEQRKPRRSRVAMVMAGLAGGATIVAPFLFRDLWPIPQNASTIVDVDSSKLPPPVQTTHTPSRPQKFDLPARGTYSGQNRNASANRSDPAYTIFCEDVFCYGQAPPSRKIGGIWVRDRLHPIEKLGYYVYRQWPTFGSIVVVNSYDGQRYTAAYFNGPNIETADILSDSSLANGHGEFSGKRISDDCSVDGTYDRGFKSDIHTTWRQTLSEFAPGMLP